MAIGVQPAGSQGWDEYKTQVPLPIRKVAHPFELLATSDGRLHLAWISGADRKGALYTAAFHEKSWSRPRKVINLPRPCQFVLFELNRKPHLLECGSGRYVFAVLEKDEWKRLEYPLPRGARQVASTPGPGKGVTLAFIADRKRISRTARPGAITERAGKVFVVHLPEQGKPGKPRGMDLKSQSRASRPVPVVDGEGTVHVLFERRYGRKARSSIAYLNTKKRNSVVSVSRQPGSRPALAIISGNERVAIWCDRQGVKESMFNGHRWNVPSVRIQNAAGPNLFMAGKNRLHLTALTKGHSLYYLTKTARNWSMPMDFGTSKGPGRAVESLDGTIHLIWENRGTFMHRALRAAPDKAKKADRAGH